jgi:hypothetical protein
MDFHLTHLAPENEYTEEEDIVTLNFGASYDLGERIRLKGQFARVKDSQKIFLISQDELRTPADNFSVYALAVSIFF